MPRVRCYDIPGGDTMIYDIVGKDGYRMNAYSFEREEDSETSFDNLPNMKFRDDDFILCGYPKSGNNWLFEMITMAKNNNTELTTDILDYTFIEGLHWKDGIPDNIPSPRLITTHLPVRYLPKDIKDKQLKIILLCRNPKDIVVSFYNYTRKLKQYEYNGKFENYLQMFMRGDVNCEPYTDYLRDWQQHIKNNPDWPIHLVYYEDLIENCFKELEKIVQFMGFSTSGNTMKKIVETCSIDNMKAQKIKAFDNQGLTEVLKKNGGYFNVFNKGQVGTWKSQFTVAQNEAFDLWWEEKAGNLNMFSFKYTQTS